MSRESIIEEIVGERNRQDAKWGVQRHTPLEWLPILAEEFGEVGKAVCESYFPGYPNSGKLDNYPH